MNNSTPYVYRNKPQRPKFISMLIGFAISVIAGIFFELVVSFFFALIGQGGGLECMTIPMVILVLAGSAAAGYFSTVGIDKKINRVR